MQRSAWIGQPCEAPLLHRYIKLQSTCMRIVCMSILAYNGVLGLAYKTPEGRTARKGSMPPVVKAAMPVASGRVAFLSRLIGVQKAKTQYTS